MLYAMYYTCYVIYVGMGLLLSLCGTRLSLNLAQPEPSDAQEERFERERCPGPVQGHKPAQRILQ